MMREIILQVVLKKVIFLYLKHSTPTYSYEGKLIITGVFVDSEDKIQITLRTPILSVVIDPTGQRGFIYGTSTGELIHQKKGSTIPTIVIFSI